MSSDLLFSDVLAGRARHPYPSRGRGGGELSNVASSPVIKTSGGELANFKTTQPLIGVRRLVSSPPVLSSPPIEKSPKMVANWRTSTKQSTLQKNRPVSQVRAGYQKKNMEVAGIILERIAKYGGEDAVLVQWARAVLAKAAPTVKGPLFGRT